MQTVMCGRFALVTPPARLARYFQAVLDDREEDEPHPSWNVAATDPVLGVRVRRSKETDDRPRVLTRYRWGLIPSWAKDTAAGNRLFNARAETVASKAAFRSAFASHRILDPGGWLLRVAQAGRRHQAALLLHPHRRGAAGLRWHRASGGGTTNAPADAPGIRSCSIITTAAGHDMDGIHDRMPVDPFARHLRRVA